MPSVLDELDDQVYVESARHVVELAVEMEDALGRKPSLSEFLELLSSTFRSLTTELFDDVSPTAVAALVPRLAKNPKKILPGTVIGIPASGGWFLAVYLKTNTFGDAFGILAGKRHTARLRNVPPKPCGVPLYSSVRWVRDGTWKVVGHSAEALAWFPADPEIYHRKRDHPSDPAIGEFGAAQGVDEKIRNIDRQEAEAVGLLDGGYQSAFLAEELVRYLERRCSKA